MNPVEFRFKVDGLTPATLPMWRQAEYMRELARLLGEKEHVRFLDLEPGSAIFRQQVEHQAAPKVRARVLSLLAPDASDDVMRPFRRLDQMLADDNAVGELRERNQRSVVVRFPGRDGTTAEIGPIVQEGSVSGELVWVGGEDRTAHAHVRDGDVKIPCEVPRDVAKQLGSLLFQNIRLSGKGRWKRNRNGAWELLEFKATDFAKLSDATFREAVTQLREVGLGDWKNVPDAAGELRRLRKGA
ncbi:MAG: hypothetical protein EXQ95_01295 [Alphaproteobacteria bacterium]|nr:hypothetical protein [Alphaproteobacteria bacterium]